MAEPTRLDALIKKWESGAGFHLDDAEEFIRLAIARLDDLCSGPHLSLASTEELRGELERRETEPYPATPAESFTIDAEHATPAEAEMAAKNPCAYGVPSHRPTATSVSYEMLSNLGRQENLLREMLESLGRIEESLIVSKPACVHEWLGDNAHRAVCRKCGTTVMPYLT
jgi:hypothetical protein